MTNAQDFEMVQIDDGHWLIHDLRHPSSDAKYITACVTRTADDGVDVVWLDRSIPLSVRYDRRQDALDELIRWSSRQRSTRPVDIPSFPPFSDSRSRRSTQAITD